MSSVKPQPVPLRRRLVAEALGTALLVTVVVGSGIAAAALSPSDIGLQLLQNSTATAFGLAVLILVFGPVSGAHFNPVVSAADWLLGRRSGTGLTLGDVLAYTTAQTLGGIAGTLLAHAMFDLPLAQISTQDRASVGRGLGEVVATTGLILVIFALARTGRAAMSAAAVGGYVGAAYWFTSSTSFANPAVTIGRMFTDTFTGITPASAPLFVGAQILGAAVGLGLVRLLFPDAAVAADRVTVPHATTGTERTDPCRNPACCSSACTTPADPRWPQPSSPTCPTVQ